MGAPERQRFHHRKSYASRRGSRKNRNSALFVQNAGNILDKMDKVRGRVRTLSAVAPPRKKDLARCKSTPATKPEGKTPTRITTSRKTPPQSGPTARKAKPKFYPNSLASKIL